MNASLSFRSNKKKFAEVFEKYRFYKFLCLDSNDPSNAEMKQYCEGITHTLAKTS